MRTKNKKKTDISYDYTTNIFDLEEENRILRETIDHLKEEIERYRRTPLLVCEVKDIIKERALIRLQNGNEFLVSISDECKDIKPGDFVLAEQKNLTVVEKIPVSKTFNVNKFVIIEKPQVTWKDIGGLDKEIKEIKEVIELPLKRPDLFKKIGIEPPKGILLYGPPGTGKTLLAKAVANSTNSTFIEIVGSELVQKFIGEGAKLIKEIFELAREKAPSIVFIDELDAIAAVRVDIGTSGEREVQRTFMQLLSEIDGFKNLGNVKIIGCTNRIDILDPAILRPGRLDRLIKIDLPDKKARKDIFKIHTRRMNLDKGINIDKIINKMEGFSGAEIKAVVTEAGYFAIRNKRIVVKEKDFLNAIKRVKEEEKDKEYLEMFG